ncbi:hypothetical protein [Nocardia sp. NPDC019395]|uniref:hypothetical protein n=1 Tax=Nocardia sp. NPDC019395 TaxID=3154686 RepID=UPI003400BC97
MTQPDPSTAETGADQHVCQFPVSFDPATGEFEVAGHPIPEGPARRGRKSEYCGEMVFDPDGTRRRHDRATAFQRRRELQLEAAGQAPRKSGPEPAPVTSARASLRELLAQIQMATTSHRTQMGEMLDKVADIVATAGDPDAAVAEVARIRTEARGEIEAAQARAGEAEAEAISARRERDRALEDKVLAEGAADDAIADRDTQVAQAHAEAEQARRDADQAQTAATEARAAREQAVATANEQVATVKREAAEEIATLRAETEARIQRIQTDTQDRIDRVEAQLTAATTDRTQAEHERGIAEQAAADARADAERSRRDLTNTQAAHRDELAQLREDIAAVRAEARTDREQLRRDHAAEVTRIQESAAAQVNALRAALSTAESTISRLETEIARPKGDR